ncbi:class I SAM-dependent methyltransferase [Amycolatopsis sp. NPDC059657]|uniref:class I SAM-dependent methyltransferase n=1 Tax=Amycolatopsis sp. NPDC059657 TaxID=3346899 RepID=UPI00366AA27B
MYDIDVAEVWDPVYRGRGRDYVAEAAEVTALIRERKPDAISLLDVACGTGEHLRSFRDHFDRVAGVELSEDMIAVGRVRSPELSLTQGDMRTFDLGTRFDAISCMFSSVGHLDTPAELAVSFKRFAAHLEPGGVVIVEPWWFPSTFLDGYVTGDIVETGGRTISRVSHSSLEGGKSRVQIHFTVASPGEGIHHFTESILISLFTQEEHEAAFEEAGFAVEYVEGGPQGRGLFVGVLK